MISVAIVDDQPLIRAGLRMIVDSQPDLVLAGEGGDGAEAVELARAHRPEVMLLDVRMPGTDGIAAVPGILAASGATRVLMLTTFDLDEYVYGALRAGAAGFLLKDAGPEQILAAIHAIAAGDVLLAPTLTRRLVEQYVARPPRASADGPLTPSPTGSERCWSRSPTA
ncbi:response regulator [Microbacterium sp. KUDC0406]|uniref:response regulator n=1 Tax=Microbacterium sp. KUDC0406 TaxID=2909588 RepID=UPI003FA5ED9E